MLMIIRGLPGAGKNTLAHWLVNGADYPECVQVFETDQYFQTSDGYKFDGTKLREAHLDCQRRTREWLEKTNHAIVANTFTQRWEYQPYLDMAKELNIKVQVIEVHGNFQNIRGVPPEKVESMRKRWEPHT